MSLNETKLVQFTMKDKYKNYVSTLGNEINPLTIVYRFVRISLRTSLQYGCLCRNIIACATVKINSVFCIDL